MKRKFVTLVELRTVIKQTRKSLGWSLQGLGSRVNIDRNTIKLMEDGKINDPGVSRILRILTVLGLDASALMSKEDEGSNIEQIALLIQEEKLFNDKQKRILVELIMNMAKKNMNKIKNILMVDDQEIFLKGAKSLFEKRNFNIATAFNYDEAVSQISKGSIDLVLIDVDLREEKNGLDVLQFVKKEFPKIPCVMLSGIRDQETAQKAMADGAFDYVDKQEDIEKVFLIINKLEEYSQLRDSYDQLESLMWT